MQGSEERASRASGSTCDGSVDRDALVIEFLWLADRYAAGYTGRGEHYDDSRQVAVIGLIKAARGTTRIAACRADHVYDVASLDFLGALRGSDSPDVPLADIGSDIASATARIEALDALCRLDERQSASATIRRPMCM